MFRSVDLSVEKRRELRELEAQASHIRLRQAVIVNDLDKSNIAAGDGYRSMTDWVSAEIDLTRATASDLVSAARLLAKHRSVNYRLAEGFVSFDRGLALMRLAQTGADEATLTWCEGLDLAGVARLTARQRRVTRVDERRVFDERYVAVQPNLDESAWRISGVLPSMEGKVVSDALCGRADELRLLPGGDMCTRGQRQADALVVMAMDSMDRDHDRETPGGSSVSILVDLDEANGTGGEKGAELE